MLLNSDYFTPAELTGYARAALADTPANQFALAQWLPWRPIDDLSFRFSRGGGGLIAAAEYRAYDTEASIAGRQGVTRVSGELPPISRKIVLGEYDRLRTRANPTDAIRSEVQSDTERVVRQIAARLELARGDALVNGSVTINENGVSATIDFARDSSMVATAATLWSDTALSDPIADLTTWSQAQLDLTGQRPAVFLTSTRIRGYMLRNAAIRSIAATLAGTPNQVSPETLNAVLQSYDLPEVRVYDARVSVAGTSTRVIADTKGLLLPAAVDPHDAEGTDLGGTFTGTTAESLDASYGIADAERAGIVAGVYRSEDPIALWTKASAIAVPVMANPNLAFCATVAS